MPWRFLLQDPADCLWNGSVEFPRVFFGAELSTLSYAMLWEREAETHLYN